MPKLHLLRLLRDAGKLDLRLAPMLSSANLSLPRPTCLHGRSQQQPPQNHSLEQLAGHRCSKLASLYRLGHTIKPIKRTKLHRSVQTPPYQQPLRSREWSHIPLPSLFKAFSLLRSRSQQSKSQRKHSCRPVHPLDGLHLPTASTLPRTQSTPRVASVQTTIMALAAASTSHAFAAGAMASTAGLTAAGSSTSRSSCAFQCAGLPPLRLVTAANRKPVGVRCEAGSDGPGPLTEIRESVDRVTKRNLTKDEILRHQETDESEKRSVFGAKPTSGAPYPRPEIERRPETGDKSFTSVFAFDGAAPELINGRLAMVGFVWALVAEKLTGLTVLEQLWSPTSTGLVYFVGAVQLLTYASLVPIANGESSDARSWGPFNAKAERWNGRLAMLGFAALIIDELFRGVPLIH